MKERLYEILSEEKTHEIIPFLKTLKAKDKKELVPAIKKMDREISKIVMTKNSYHTSGSAEQHSIIDIASFVCMDRKHYGKDYWSLFRNMEQTNEILEWGCPAWFSDFINESVDAEYTAFNYQHIIEWSAKGYIQPSPELLGSHLSDHPRDLEKYPETLKVHFWHLCEFPSRSLPFYKEWLPLIQKLINEEKIERKRFLKECLLASNRNFNKNVTGWFMDAFTALKPSDEELIELQDELFAGLPSVQSKAVNTILAHLKKIVSSADFKSEEFSNFLPNLLSSEVKATLMASLILTEKLLHKEETDTENLGMALSAAFVSKDESIQLRTAKIIQKYIPASDGVKVAISHYSENMLANARLILEDYLSNEDYELEEVSVERMELIHQENEVQEPQNFEDLMFFLPQAIDHSGTYYYDLALSGLVRFAGDADSGSVKLMEPVFQKACKTIAKWEVAPYSIILCNMIINYGLMLIEKFPYELRNLDKIYRKIFDEESTREQYKHYDKKIGPIEGISFGSFTMSPYKKIAVDVFDKIKKGNTIPLLSTVTHEPCWISPAALVERFEIYQNENIVPNDYDVQLALQRCALDNTDEALKQAEEKLKGEYKELLVFFFNKKNTPKGPFTHPSWWMTAGITRSPETVFEEFKDFGYTTIPKEFFTGNYNWITTDNKKNSYYPVELSITIPKYHFEKRQHPLFLEYCIAEQKDSSDIPALLWSFPNTPAHVIAKIIKIGLFYSGLSEVYERGLTLRTAQALHQIKKPLDSMGYLFLGTTLLDGDKTIRNTACEIWLEHVSLQMIDNVRLGEVIGLHEKLEWAPVKRFTDLIQNNMMNVSRNHNLALEVMISSILLQMETPITNLKKLLEIYHEILALNQSKIDAGLQDKLDSWKENSTLKKVCSLLLK
ncbi:DUF6493 family protein [Chryseobacterium soli]|uniref:DUF6493 family protein n=1 Tax=Chryseobacterium soli TaxID=445961 RepID=UPI00295454B1|nr:DUF6493 family protein [Chryseobacterium soli]MDV7698987.1 DUF6493 family protein [Chryseobacterium soli]